MLDLPLAAALLDAVPHNPNLQLVLVGVAPLSNMLQLPHLACSGLHVSMLQDTARLQAEVTGRHANCHWLTKGCCRCTIRHSLHKFNFANR